MREYPAAEQDRWVSFAFERLREEYSRYRQVVQTLAHSSIALNALGAAFVVDHIAGDNRLFTPEAAVDNEDVIVHAELLFRTAGIAFGVGVVFGFLFCMFTAHLLRKCFTEYNMRTMAYFKNEITDREFIYEENNLERAVAGILISFALFGFFVGLCLAIYSSYSALS